LGLLEEAGVSAAFLPSEAQLYADGYSYKVIENKESFLLCGAHRPGHFDGVLTVVLKLLNLVQPHQAFFGEKDYQQLRLIQKMTENFFLPIEIKPVATVRETDGLALSSRNLRLTKSEREIAPELYKILKSNLPKAEAVLKLETLGFRVDYIEEYWGRRFAAAHLGGVRLIDNVELL
jgi:pantoate--beta-alanine ligase